MVEADAMHAILRARADALEGCTAPEEVQLKAISDAVNAYEAIPWPEGKAAGGKGLARACRYTAKVAQCHSPKTS
jgi:hypothetical protein